jgi:hypothetical protein
MSCAGTGFTVGIRDDGVGVIGPDERFAAFVAAVDERGDGVGQVADRTEARSRRSRAVDRCAAGRPGRESRRDPSGASNRPPSAGWSWSGARSAHWAVPRKPAARSAPAPPAPSEPGSTWSTVRVTITLTLHQRCSSDITHCRARPTVNIVTTRSTRQGI